MAIFFVFIDYMALLIKVISHHKKIKCNPFIRKIFE